MPERRVPILIAGGGLGGLAAALSAAQLGWQVLLTEENAWIGGQLTAQGVPPDEHRYIEAVPGTASYGRLREGIRARYRRERRLPAEVLADPCFNPGGGEVGPLCCAPPVALAVLEEMLAPFRAVGKIEALLRHRPVAVEADGDRVAAVVVEDVRTHDRVTVAADLVLDATELGDLLELGGVEHVVGAESRDETGEPHALPGPADPTDQQAINHGFAVEWRPGEHHVIDRPVDYDFWREYRPSGWPARLFGWHDVNPITLAPRRRALFETDERIGDWVGDDFFRYRRIVAADPRISEAQAGDVTLVNWPQNNYVLGPLVGVDATMRERHLAGARSQSLAFLHWLQTEAPRHDGGCGYPELKPRGDLLGTADGLAQAVYVQESRRIRAELTVLEQHVGVDARPGTAGATEFPDSVGVGRYRMDLHPSCSGRTYLDLTAWPFQIPLGLLLPVRVENLLPCSKNVGTTHLTNGCFRLHPVEWSIGVAAGALAAYSLARGEPPRAVRRRPALLADFQRLLADRLGVALAWPEPMRTRPTLPPWETHRGRDAVGRLTTEREATE